MLYPFQVLLYNSSKFLPNLLASINSLDLGDDTIELRFREQSQDAQEIEASRLLIDAFETADKVSVKYSQGENLGFGAGHNRIFQQMGTGEDFFILNPDGLLMFDFITQFKAFTKSVSDQPWAILEASQFPMEHPKGFDVDTYVTKWSSGACCYINSDFFIDSGGFDENIFMYCEDVDLSFRARTAGQKVLHMPQVKFIHITQDLDEGKDRTQEKVHSLAGSLYLRKKYADDAKVKEYEALITDFNEYPAIREQFAAMSKKLRETNLLDKSDYDDFFIGTEFASHRW